MLKEKSGSILDYTSAHFFLQHYGFSLRIAYIREEKFLETKILLICTMFYFNLEVFL